MSNLFEKTVPSEVFDCLKISGSYKADGVDKLLVVERFPDDKGFKIVGHIYRGGDK